MGSSMDSSTGSSTSNNMGSSMDSSMDKDMEDMIHTIKTMTMTHLQTVVTMVEITIIMDRITKLYLQKNSEETIEIKTKWYSKH